MKHLNTYITEYIIKKKLDTPIDSEDHYKYFPKTKSELIEIIKNLLNDNQTNLNIIDVSKITDMSELFDKINQSIEISNIDISGWDVSNVTNMRYMFFGCSKFNCDLSSWNVSNVEDITGMFINCVNLNSDFSNWNMHNVTNMKYMFYGCKKFEGKGLENWDVSNVENMSCMFQNCDLNKWNLSSNIKAMNYVFDECTSLKNKPKWYVE